MPFPRSIRSLLLLAALTTPALAQTDPSDHPFQQTHPAMGTEFTLELYAPTSTRAQELFTAAFDEIDRLDALLSNYQPTSELSRIARTAAQTPTTTDPETFHFLSRSLFWSQQSHGAFDITVGPLLRLWGFFNHGGAVPSPATLARTRTHVGYQLLHLDPATRTVTFLHHQPLELDPGSIGKGFAVDSVIRLLRSASVTRALLSAGNSTVYALGTPPNQPGWPIHIPNPLQPSAAITVLLHDTSISTGACTEKFFIEHGHRFCHIFDPRTGRPVEDVLQSTVIDPSATDSDALSTVLFVLPPAQSRELLTHHPEARALLFRTADPTCTAIHWPQPTCAGDRPHPPAETTPRKP